MRFERLLGIVLGIIIFTCGMYAGKQLLPRTCTTSFELRTAPGVQCTIEGQANVIDCTLSQPDPQPAAVRRPPPLRA